MIVFGAIQSSDPYQESLARAKQHSDVQQLLGTPIEEGWFVLGNIEVNNNSGNADLQIPISGPKGSGTISVVATKIGGKWEYSWMQVESPTLEEPIDLLAPGNH